MKIRKEVKIQEDVFKKLQELARADRRTLSNFIEKILMDFVNNTK